MTATVLRKELHSMIDIMPDQSLPAIKPLLAFLTEDYWKPIIEPATPEEIAMINERMKDFEKGSASFIPFESTAGVQ